MSNRAVVRDVVDESSDVLIEKGYIEFCLTDKAGKQERYQAELRKALASNSPAEIAVPTPSWEAAPCRSEAAERYGV